MSSRRRAAASFRFLHVSTDEVDLVAKRIPSLHEATPYTVLALGRVRGVGRSARAVGATPTAVPRRMLQQLRPLPLQRENSIPLVTLKATPNNHSGGLFMVANDGDHVNSGSTSKTTHRALDRPHGSQRYVPGGRERRRPEFERSGIASRPRRRRTRDHVPASDARCRVGHNTDRPTALPPPRESARPHESADRPFEEDHLTSRLTSRTGGGRDPGRQMTRGSRLGLVERTILVTGLAARSVERTRQSTSRNDPRFGDVTISRDLTVPTLDLGDPA